MTGCVQPVHLRHNKIHQRQMRCMKMKCRQRMMAVNRFPDHNPIGAPFQCGFQGRSRRRTVVYYKDTNQAISLSRSSVQLIGTSFGAWRAIPQKPDGLSDYGVKGAVVYSL
jgi:hypothetical protein